MTGQTVVPLAIRRNRAPSRRPRSRAITQLTLVTARTVTTRLLLEGKQRPVVTIDEAHHLRNAVLEKIWASAVTARPRVAARGRPRFQDLMLGAHAKAAQRPLLCQTARA